MNKNGINEYDRISDDIYWFGMDTVLRINVSLSKRNQDGTRRPFYSEYEYDSKYTDKHRSTSIKRSFDYYLSIENIKDKETFTMIQSSDMYAMRSVLDKVSKWFINNRIFAIVEDKLIVKTKVKPEEINLRNFKTLTFEPVIVRFSEIVTPGVRLVFSNDMYTDITADKFMGFKYHIDSIDLYMAASILVNFIEIPEKGSNLMSIPPEANKTSIIDFGEEKESSITIKPQKRKSNSYFDKLDDM